MLALVIDRVAEPCTDTEIGPSCHRYGGNTARLPDLVRRLLRPGDTLKPLSPDVSAVLVERSQPQAHLLYTPIGHVAQPKPNKGGTGLLARVELPKGSRDLDALFLSAEAIGADSGRR